MRQPICAILRMVVGGTFAVSGLLKLIYQSEFIEALQSYGFISGAVINVTAVVLPHLEIALGLMLVFGLWARAVSKGLIILLLLFSSVAGVALAQGIAVDCGCFPVADTKQPVSAGLFIRNGLLVLSCLFIAFRSKESQRLITK